MKTFRAVSMGSGLNRRTGYGTDEALTWSNNYALIIYFSFDMVDDSVKAVTICILKMKYEAKMEKMALFLSNIVPTWFRQHIEMVEYFDIPLSCSNYLGIRIQELGPKGVLK